MDMIDDGYVHETHATGRADPTTARDDSSRSATAPMTIYLALDLLNGRAVRITRTADGQTTVAEDEPVAVARRWQMAGATWLHVVDLDGAREGGLRHGGPLRAIVEATGLRIQFGGGVHSEEDVAAAFAAGAARVTLATAAVRDAEGEATLAACLARWSDAIAVSVDAHDGQITVGSWLPWATGSATDFAQAMARLGVRTLIVTNLGSDDSLAPGMDNAYALLAELRAALPQVALVAAGGVATLDDLRRLAGLGVSGVVVGRALYDGAVDLTEALAVAAATPYEPSNADEAFAPTPDLPGAEVARDDDIGDVAAADTIETPAVSTPSVNRLATTPSAPSAIATDLASSGPGEQATQDVVSATPQQADTPNDPASDERGERAG